MRKTLNDTNKNHKKGDFFWCQKSNWCLNNACIMCFIRLKIRCVYESHTKRCTMYAQSTHCNMQIKRSNSRDIQTEAGTTDSRGRGEAPSKKIILQIVKVRNKFLFSLSMMTVMMMIHSSLHFEFSTKARIAKFDSFSRIHKIYKKKKTRKQTYKIYLHIVYWLFRGIVTGLFFLQQNILPLVIPISHFPTDRKRNEQRDSQTIRLWQLCSVRTHTHTEREIERERDTKCLIINHKIVFRHPPN